MHSIADALPHLASQHACITHLLPRLQCHSSKDQRCVVLKRLLRAQHVMSDSTLMCSKAGLRAGKTACRLACRQISEEQSSV